MVDFSEPPSPASPITSPRFMSKSTPLTAVKRPFWVRKSTCSPRTSTRLEERFISSLLSVRYGPGAVELALFSDGRVDCPQRAQPGIGNLVDGKIDQRETDADN